MKDLETTIAELKEIHEEDLKAAEDTTEQLVQVQSAVVELEAKLKRLTEVIVSISQNFLKYYPLNLKSEKTYGTNYF